MDPRKNRWAFALIWINLAVAVVVLIQIAGNQISSTRELLYIVGYSLVFANLTGVLGVLILGTVMERLQRRRLPPIPAAVLAILALTGVGCLLAQTLLMVIGLVVPRHFWADYFDTLKVAVPLSAVFGLGALLHASLQDRVHSAEEKLHEKEIAEERARKLATEARLRALESQIHPHFLFNTLNSISSLIASNPARAEQIVCRLAALLRASLDNSNQPLVPLRQELAIVESYIDIERARFGDQLRSAVKVPPELRDAQVPSMSVQSLVENSVKYGITPHSGGGEVTVVASAENGNLRIEVQDTGPGFELSAVPAGHGLDNLVGRLDAIFGTKARLNAFRRDGQSVVEMVLPRV